MVVVVLVAVVAASQVNLDYYVLSPGDAQAVGPKIAVPRALAHRTIGPILLTDVFVSRVTALGYLFDHLSSGDQLVPASAVLGVGIPGSELAAQGYLEMAQAKAAAKTAALRKLGYKVAESDRGAVIEAVTSSAPAFGKLAVGDVVTALDGTAVTTVCDLVVGLSSLMPGSMARLGVQQVHFARDGGEVAGRSVTVSVRLGEKPKGLAAAQSGCPKDRPGGGFLGVAASTQQDFTYPFRVTIDTGGIGGPSAGLALTLGLLDTLSAGELTGGARVAATGTIDPEGLVGDVGGVPQKTVAVERAGANVFLVPKDEVTQARGKATASLHVYGVTSLNEAIGVLKRLGGRL
ncbi:MAG: PDZ domain-containing protein [Acidimicrobiales bacterium]